MTIINPIKIHHKGKTGIGMFVGLLVLVIFWGLAFLIFYLSRDFLNSADAIARKIPFIISGTFLILGLVVATIFIRQEFDEHISIDSIHVTYKKSGRMRKTIKWTETSDMYQAIEESEEEAVEEMRNLTLKLKHSRNSEKDIILEKNLSNEKERMEKRTYYKKLLKLA